MNRHRRSCFKPRFTRFEQILHHHRVFRRSLHCRRCTVHFYGNVWTAVPTSKVKEVAALLKAIHAQEDRVAARQKVEAVTAKLQR